LANTYTTFTNLAMPALNDTGWNAPINANAAQIDGMEPLASLAVATTEVPSASLNVKVAPGTFAASNDLHVGYAGVASIGMTASSTNYLYLTDLGALVVTTAGWPTGTMHVRLATVVAGVSTITSITGQRVPYASAGVNLNTVYLALAGGTLNDAAGVVAVHTGSAHGTVFGGSAAELVGFFGAAPVAQQAMGVATAGTAYTANEQAMLQKVYNALRTLGLGS
jgi:hypothetical protein